MALQPQRDRRLLDYERRARIEERETARATISQMEKQHKDELCKVRKELRADAAEVRRVYEGDERGARVALEEQLMRVRNENTELGCQLRAAQRAARLSQQDARSSDEESAAAKAAAKAELARVKEHGRAWAKEQGARRGGALLERRGRAQPGEGADRAARGAGLLSLASSSGGAPGAPHAARPGAHAAALLRHRPDRRGEPAASRTARATRGGSARAVGCAAPRGGGAAQHAGGGARTSARCTAGGGHQVQGDRRA
eukprot:924223-Prymnesium_polylepis.1